MGYRQHCTGYQAKPLFVQTSVYPHRVHLVKGTRSHITECWRSSIFVLVLILTLVSIGLGHWIGLGSKIPFYLLSYLSTCHSQNYGVKMRKFTGRGKDPLPVSSLKRYFKPRSVCLPYGTICICVLYKWEQKHVSISISTTDGNRNMFLFPFQRLMETETCFRFHFNDWWKWKHISVSNQRI